MLIQRNITRTIKVATETTLQTSTPTSDPLTFELLDSESFYVGYKGKFASRFFFCNVLNTAAATLTVTYWDGSAWSALEDVIDGTLGFTKNGFISWQNVTDWEVQKLTPVTDRDLFWIRIKTGTSLDATTRLQLVDNLYCDDALVRAYYSELIADTRWFPEGRTDFLEQYIAAKDLVVLRLKKERVIRDESQIIDPNEVSIASVHAAAHIIYSQANLGEDDDRATMAEDKMNNELNKVPLDIDTDDSGIIGADEEEIGNVFIPRGGY